MAVHASTLVPASVVRSEIRTLSHRPTAADSVARYLLLRPVLDAIAPGRARERLSALARQEGAPVLALRASVDLVRHGRAFEDATRARFGFVTRWVTRPGPRASSLAEAHRSAVDGLNLAKGSDSEWTPVRPDAPDGSVVVMATEGAPAAQHFIAEIYALRDTTVHLRLGVSGATVVSLDGAWVGEVPAMAFPSPDQLDVPLSLSAGPHRLALSLATEPGSRCTLFARLTDPRGRRALLVEARAPSSEMPRVPLPSPETVPGLTAVPEANPRDGSFASRIRAAAARRALGLPEPLAVHEGLRLEELAQAPAFLRLPLIQSVLAARLLNGDHQRMAAFAALSRHGPHGWVLPIAASTAMDRGQNFRALDLLHAAKSKAEPTVLARVQLALARDRPGSASSQLAALGAKGPPSERLLRVHGQVSLAAARPDIALPSLRALQTALPGDGGLRFQLADVLVELGEHEEAMSLLGDAPPHPLGDAPFKLQAASVAARRGDRSRALAWIAELEGNPESVDVVVSLARLLEELGESERAQGLWKQALRRRPGDPDLRAEWERSQPIGSQNLPFVFEAVELAALPRAPEVGLPFEILGDETHIQVRADGGWRRYDQRILRVLRVPDGRDARTNSVRFDPSRQQARVLRAQVLRDGLVLPVTSRELYQVSDENYGYYYDLQELSVVFDDLKPGDVVTIQNQLDSGPQPGIQATFGLVHTLHESLPKRRLRITLEAPAALPLEAVLHRPETGRGRVLEMANETGPDGLQRWVITGEDLPALVAEPDATVVPERSAILHVSSQADWPTVVSDYARLLDPSRVITPAMRAWVAARQKENGLMEGAPPTVALAQALAVGVAREIRYVGLEFGEHGYRPYGTDQVWSRRFGDCKDQANLLVALMDLAGLEAHVTLVRTRPHGRLQAPLSTLALFDHAIVYVPQWDTYFDPTSRHHSWGDLPEIDQGAQALVIAPGEAARLARLPESPASRNGVEGTYVLTLGSDGGAYLDGRATFRGTLAADYRSRLADEGSRAERLEEILNGRYPGLELRSQTLTGLDAHSNHVGLAFKARISSLAAPAGEGLEVRRPAGLDGLASRWAATATRETPLRLPPAALHVLSFRYVLPAGWVADGLPPDASEAADFGSYTISWSRADGDLHVENRLELSASEIAPEDYPAFRAFLERHDAVLRVPLAVRPAGKEAPK
jgi:tetratricopeptide (TPR) repeat protein